MLHKNNLINVFLSSRMGNDIESKKYMIARQGLKKIIESTGLANVYLFEEEGASTLPAEEHYTKALERSDLCIFLIDNKDGVPEGVLSEIKTVNKNNIKSLYYFCDEKEKEKTTLQESITGATHSKSQNIHTFEEILTIGADHIIKDIITIYKQYCSNELIRNDLKVNNELIKGIELSNTNGVGVSLIEKGITQNIDAMKAYLMKLFFDYDLNIGKTNKIDRISVKFLEMFFENKSVKSVDINDLVDELSNQRTEDEQEILRKRLHSIKAYYDNDIIECNDELKAILEIVKNKNFPEWLKYDILIDLRNIEIKRTNGGYTEVLKDYQKQISEGEGVLYYPIMDRFSSNLFEQLINDGINSLTKSPYSVTLGSGEINGFVNSIASMFVIAIINGSLTHFLNMHQSIKKMFFYLSNNNSNWNLKITLLKEEFVCSNSSEIDRTIDYFDEILATINQEETFDIYQYCENVHIDYKKMISELEVLRVFGYFLSDMDFERIWKSKLQEILNWCADPNQVASVSLVVFKTIVKIQLRINQNDIVKIINAIFDNGLKRFYDDIFKLISETIDIAAISDIELLNKLIENVILVIKSDDNNIQSSNLEYALIQMRKTDDIGKNCIEKLDDFISKNMNDFYTNLYELETDNSLETNKKFIESSLSDIQSNILYQNEHGVYFKSPINPFKTIENILLRVTGDLSEKLKLKILEILVQTIKNVNININDKIDAIQVVILLINKNLSFKEKVSNEISHDKNNVETGEKILSNATNLILRFNALLLYHTLEENIYDEMLELISENYNDEYTQIRISEALRKYISHVSYDKIIELEPIILQKTLIWVNSNNPTVRFNAVHIMFALLESPVSSKLICKNIVKIAERDNVHIKSVIIKNMNKLSKTDINSYEYIKKILINDSNFRIRKQLENL